MWGAARLDHAPGLGGTKNNPLWTTSAPNVFSRQGVGDLRGGKVWSKWAAPPANQRGIVNSVGWCGAPRVWTTRPAWEEQKTTHFGQPPRPPRSADRVWERAAAATTSITTTILLLLLLLLSLIITIITITTTTIVTNAVNTATATAAVNIDIIANDFKCH